jgi:hypothetical protein
MYGRVKATTEWAARRQRGREDGQVTSATYGNTDIRVVDLTVPKGWDRLLDRCPYMTRWGLKTLCSGLQAAARTAVIEPHYICRDFRNLFSHFYSKKFLPRDAHCSRVHFFSASGLDELQVTANSDAWQSDYLGFSVIQPVVDRCLGRSVYDPLRLGRDPREFFCLQATTPVHINGAQYVVRGYPYISQTGEALVCAHAALWGVCRFLSQRFRMYREVLPNDLIQMTATNAGRQVPYRGMSYSDYSEILSEFGCYPAVLRAGGWPPEGTPDDALSWTRVRATYHDIYSYVESGFPVLTSFRDHVATTIGHVIGSAIGKDHKPEELVAARPVYNSFSLIRQLVVVDDNVFPYALLGYKGDPDNYAHGSSSNPRRSIDAIYAAVVPLPEKVFLRPSDARDLAYRFLNYPEVTPFIEEVLKDLGCESDPLIARLFVASGNSFKVRKLRYALDKVLGPDPLLQVPIRRNLPHFLWVMELSPISLYNHRHAIAEVVLDATASRRECERVYMRVGKRFWLGKKGAAVSGASSNFPLYTHNLGERDVSTV